ncbi:MAG: hypothetical protein KTR14_03325 [Vampirovibrio sp.]|nr:hypothetical protein [Vampirovibrio sp.]
MKMSGLFRLSGMSLLVIVMVALGIRLLQMPYGVHAWVDSTAYLKSAFALFQGEPSLYAVERTPGYPFLVWAALVVFSWFNPAVNSGMAFEMLQQTGFQSFLLWIQLALGVFTAILAAEISLAIFKHPWLARWTGICVALLPDLLFYEHSILTESLYGFSLTFLVWLYIRWPLKNPLVWAPVGLLGGWVLWVRSVGMVLLAAITGWLAKKHPQPKKAVTAFLLPVCIMVLAWSGFHHTYHGFTGYTAGAGMNQLYKTIDFIRMDSDKHQEYKQMLAQRREIYPDYKTYEAVNDAHVLFWLQEKGKRPYNQVYLDHDRIASDIAREAALSHPLAYMSVTIREGWRLLTMGTIWDPKAWVWSPLLLLFGLGSILRLKAVAQSKEVHQQGVWLIMAAVVGHFVLTPLVTVCDGRYRVPLEPLMMVLALYGLAVLWRGLKPEEQPSLE